MLDPEHGVPVTGNWRKQVALVLDFPFCAAMVDRFASLAPTSSVDALAEHQLVFACFRRRKRGE